MGTPRVESTAVQGAELDRSVHQNTYMKLMDQDKVIAMLEREQGELSLREYAASQMDSITAANEPRIWQPAYANTRD